MAVNQGDITQWSWVPFSVEPWIMSEQESRIPQAGHEAGTGLPNLYLSSAVYMPFMSVVQR